MGAAGKVTVLLIQLMLVLSALEVLDDYCAI